LHTRPIDLLPQERAAFGPLTTTAATYGLYRPATVNRESLGGKHRRNRAARGATG